VKSDPSLAGKGLKLIKTLLTDNNIDVRYKGTLFLADIVKSDPSLAGKGFELIKTLLLDNDSDVRK
jgi:vesicle coat complex subunit